MVILPLLNDDAAPPSLGLASTSVTSAPSSRSPMAALIPANPPPMTTTLRDVCLLMPDPPACS